MTPAPQPQLAGWVEDESTAAIRRWRNAEGDTLSFAARDGLPPRPDPSDVIGLQHWARAVAEQNNAGLVEVQTVEEAPGSAFAFIYKQREGGAYIYTGVLLLDTPEGPQRWQIVSKEQGTTGVRDAFATTEMMKSGQVTADNYEEVWAQDPYDPTYEGVERSRLRFRSDDPSFDARFPDHPLSKVRTELRRLAPDALVEAKQEFRLQLLDAMVVELVHQHGQTDVIRDVLVDRGYDPEHVDETIKRVRSRPRYSNVSRVRRPGKGRGWLHRDRVGHLAIALLCAGAFGLAVAFDLRPVGLFFVIVGVRSLFRAAST